MSTDDTSSARNRALTAGESIGESLAREHSNVANHVFTIFSDGAPVAPVTQSEMLRAMWGSYLGSLVRSTAGVIGTDVPAMLRQLMDLYDEEERRRAN